MIPSRTAAILFLTGLAGAPAAATAGPPDSAPRPPGRASMQERVPDPTPPARSPVDTADLSAVRKRLVAQLERAAAAGLITLEETDGSGPGPVAPPEPARDSEAGTVTPPARGSSTPSAARPVATDNAGPVAREPDAPDPRVAEGRAAADASDEAGTAAVARARALAQAASPARAPGAPIAPGGCLPVEVLILPEPREHAAPMATLSRLRRGLLGEFDRPRPDAVVALARFQLALRLTHEARAVLVAFTEPGRRRGTLLWMAGVIAGEPGPPGTDAACSDRQALWQAAAAAARGEAARAVALARRAGRALQVMPRDLAALFATRLGHAAADLGDWATARRFEAMARRAAPGGADEPPALVHLSARAALAAGRVEDGVRRLRDLWSRFPAEPGAGRALTELARLVLEDGIPGVSDSQALRRDLGVLALGARGTPRGEEAALLEARLAAGAFGRTAGLDMLALHRRQGVVGDPAYRRGVRAITADSPAQTGGPPLAVLFERDPARFSPVLVDPAFRAALAMSFARIGQPARGEAVLKPQDRGLPRVARSLGRSYLAAGRPDDAGAIASRLPAGTEKATLMARVLEARGRPGRALARLRKADAGGPALRARLAWAAGDWSEAARALDALAAGDRDPAILARRDLARRRAGRADTGPATSPAAGRPASVAAGMAPYLDRLGEEIDSYRKVLEDG